MSRVTQPISRRTAAGPRQSGPESVPVSSIADPLRPCVANTVINKPEYRGRGGMPVFVYETVVRMALYRIIVVFIK